MGARMGARRDLLPVLALRAAPHRTSDAAPPMMRFGLYVEVFTQVDGDTWRGSLDHGCHIYTGTRDHPVRFRAAHINAPELSTPAGPPARDYAAKLTPPGRYACWSTGLDNYGRPLLDLVLADGRLFSDAMLAAGQAVPLD